MTYYLYSYMFSRPGKPDPPTFAQFYGAFETGMVGLYEFVANEPEDYLITHVVEITREEYKLVDKNGIIG